MTEPLADLARSLTGAQREWLKRGYRLSGSGYWPCKNAMRRKGLIDALDNMTPLANQLRVHLSYRAAA